MRLTVTGVCFSYDSARTLDDVNLEVAEGEVLSIVGPNGSGKSTLLKCIDRILRPRQGVVKLGDQDVRRMGLRQLARSIAYVPQSAPAGMQCTVFDAVLLGRRPHINWRVSQKDAQIASETLISMGLDGLAMRQFNELSGGERQKVLIARALAQEPAVMLLDEPTSNLDLRHQLEVMRLISSAVRDKRISAIMAIHDLNLASRFSDRIIFLREGRVYAAGAPPAVLTPDNISAVYGVHVVVNNDTPSPHIIPTGVSAP